MGESMRILWTLLLLGSTARAGGFAIPEQSARAMGMAGVGTGSAEGASSIFYNPGNLAFEEGVSAELSSLLILPVFQFTPLRGQDGVATLANTRLFVIPNLFLSYPVTPRLQVGLGAFSNHGLGISWPDTFPGRFESSEANLVTFTANPTVSYKLHEQVGVGAGLDVVRGTVELAQRLNFLDTEGTLRLGGGAWGVGANAGVTARFWADALQIGAQWRGAVPLNFSGRADFSTPIEFQNQLRDQPVKTTFTLPHQFSVGARYKVMPRLKAHVDLQYTLWSAFDALRVDFVNDASLSQVEARNWKDTFTFRAGAEYGLTDTLTVRAGAGFDPSPSPSNTLSPSLPDCDRTLFSAGVGYRLGNFNLDAGYLLAWLTPRDTQGEAFPANYLGQAHLLGVTVSFRQ